MAPNIAQVTGGEAYEMIYDSGLSKLPVSDQALVHTYMITSACVWIGTEDNKILCVWGLIPPSLLGDRAYLWLFTTEHLREHVFIFIRYSQRVIADMLTRYPVIIGHAAVGSSKSIRWLKWLGARFGKPEGKLIPFEIRAKHG